MLTSEALGFRENSWWYQNSISTGCNRRLLTESRPDGLFVDGQYGRAWSFLPQSGDALYGRTELLPTITIPNTDLIGYLRTPYKRIPRIRIASQAEMKAISQAFIPERNEVLSLWRGQRKE